MADLLPPNARPLERALDAISADRFNLDPGIRLVWDPDAAPMDILPWLAYAYSVDLWDDGWSEETKRSVTAQSLLVHARKGTVGALKDAIRAAGYGECDVFDGLDARRRDGSVTRGGTHFYSTYTHWCWFTVVMHSPVSLPQAEQIRRIINLVKRESNRLHQLRYDRALNTRNGVVIRNGDFTRGVIDGQSI